jgi:Flp pilus assembly protein TadG
VFQPLNSVRAFASDKRGTFGIIFALTLFPMVEMAGVAIDYANAMRLNARLKSAADEAALSAVKDYARTLNEALANSKGQDVFKSQLGSTASLQNPAISFSYGADPSDPNKYLATASYTGSVSTYFAKFIRVSTINLGGAAQATYKKMTYKNFFFVVDASESMGLAASKTDITKMSALTGGCALACHVIESGQTQSNQEIAQANGVKTRLDIIKETIKTLLDDTASANAGTKYISFGIYTMRKQLTALNATAGLSKVSSDYGALKNVTDTIDLLGGPFPENWTYTDSLASLLDDIPVSGDGSTPAQAENYVFLMTDGVTDVADPGTSPVGFLCPGTGHCTQPLQPAVCDPFKASPKNATVAVLYTTYLDVGSHYWSHVYPFVTQLAPNLTSCASQKYFIQGTHADEITAGIRYLFYQAIGAVRLSQ